MESAFFRLAACLTIFRLFTFIYHDMIFTLASILALVVQNQLVLAATCPASSTYTSGPLLGANPMTINAKQDPWKSPAAYVATADTPITLKVVMSVRFTLSLAALILA